MWYNIAMITLIIAIVVAGGLFWEIVGSFSIEDLKSDLIGVMGSLDYSSCN